MAILEVDDLRKEYGGFTAVEGSSFSIDRGEVFGVVGPNGAGKTTTLKMLAGLVEPTDGAAVVAGHTPGERAMQRKLGFLPEESPLYEEMTATDYLEFFADLYDVPEDVASERIESSLDRLDLEHRDRQIGNMSKGMKRKVAIARALINDPEVLIFDEPASGLDPLTTNHVIEFTEELSEEGKTIVFSAHNLFHVESVCDRVVIMNDGRIVARGSVEEIRDDHGGTEYHVYATVDASDALEDVPSEPVDDEVRHVVEDMDAVETIREAVEESGGTLTDIQTKSPSLEEIFLEVASGKEEDAERRQDSQDPDGETREQVVDT
ncbi:ABC transporter ATP-binding protein [Natronobacterium texcoconense]|uniref:ABC-2 type transport system ATP-binding protein n=1 Tax=Natronobacterium texcoconense TaxID=1095778 RepID=A0A1H1FCK0_NATTX|nr:ABC transporter ATP-binding protein [Natronobacterium texcoconense]SDQ98692.1 ABC-2 type transport system ATP-binding protein [Natronobacterium texcoconense]